MMCAYIFLYVDIFHIIFTALDITSLGSLVARCVTHILDFSALPLCSCHHFCAMIICRQLNSWPEPHHYIRLMNSEFLCQLPNCFSTVVGAFLLFFRWICHFVRVRANCKWYVVCYMLCQTISLDRPTKCIHSRRTMAIWTGEWWSECNSLFHFFRSFATLTVFSARAIGFCEIAIAAAPA